MAIDIVSDLSDGNAEFVPANQGDVQVSSTPALPADQQARKIDDTPKAEADKPLSVRDTISNALKADADAQTPLNAQQGDQPRGPDGKFAPKVDGQVQEPVVDANVVGAPKVAAPQGIDPQVFASLPAETQAQLARTMEDVQNSQQRFAQLAPVEQLIAPRIDAWAMAGMAPAQALHQLFALSDFAGKDPGGFIKYIAQANNVDLEALVLGMDAAEPVDPKTAALEKEVSELKTWRSAEQQQQAQAAHNRTVEQVIQFADEKDPAGNPLRPYLSELGEAWLPYIQVVKAQNPTWQHSQVLQQAYENACWANANVRGKMQDATNKAAEADRLRKDAERAEAARSASATVRTGAPAAAPRAPDDPSRNVRDTIKAAIALHS